MDWGVAQRPLLPLSIIQDAAKKSISSGANGPFSQLRAAFCCKKVRDYGADGRKIAAQDMLHKKICGFFELLYGNSSDLYLRKDNGGGIICLDGVIGM
ncbi:MAG: hypothetical protein E7446_04690 [Ruminococcaceae bacterium]|nr:hypothetical protein [Oscillospiraceae bacterium]